jgi:uncharacterized protein (UPF0276 family)
MVEVEPATQWSARRDGSFAVDAADLDAVMALRKPTVVHGVTCPTGGSCPPSAESVALLTQAADRYDSPWVSEHLSINRLVDPAGKGVDAGFLLPPLQIDEVVERAADRLCSLRAELRRPVAFETGVNYLKPTTRELRDGEFFAAVAEAADCYIVCDLHNLWCNERNGRDALRDVFAALPLDRVCEIHLAGGQEHGKYYLDAHSDLVDPELMSIAFELVPYLPALRAIVFEIMPDYVRQARITHEAYRGQIAALRALWNVRGTGQPFERSCPSQNERVRRGAMSTSAADWERDCYHALKSTRHAEATAGGPEMDSDAMALYRHLIERIRLGNLVTALPLSYRLLVRRIGVDEADSVLEQYERSTETHQWALEEAEEFLSFVQRECPHVPHLVEVVSFEIAAAYSLLDSERQTVDFTCEPGPLLDALRLSLPLPDLAAGAYRVEIDPTTLT